MKILLPKKLFPFIWYFVKEYKGALVIYTFLSFAAGLWGPFNSMLLRHIINLLPGVAAGDIGVLLFPVSLIIVNFIVFDNFTWRGITYIRYRYVPFLLNRIDSAVLDYTLQHSHQFFQERMAGTLAKQIFRLFDGIEKIVSSSACNIFRAASLLLIRTYAQTSKKI